MMTLETTQNVPLTLTENGTIRVTGSRVSLEAVVYQYEQGNSAEQIHESFPSLRLADIHAVISYDLNERILQGVQSRAEINAVLARTVGLEDKPDAAFLGWAADENRIVLSHDLQTMPGFAIARLRGGQTMPGLILVPQELRIGKAI